MLGAEIAAWILIFAMGTFAVVWAVMIVRIISSQKQLPHIADQVNAPEPEGGWPKVSVILPTHNEEGVLDACLSSVRKQDYPDLRIIVALDRCTDASPEIAKRHADEDERIVVTPNDAFRDGWRGKCLPMQVGSELAQGDWLLFVDSDTELDPGMVKGAVATANAQGFDMLSVLPDLRCEKLFEHIAQPVASLHMMHMYPPHKVNRPNGNSRPFSLGAFTLLRRSVYDGIGGMNAVKDQFMEDINLARAVSKSGARVGIAMGSGMFRCTMYEDFAEFRGGWKRIFIGAANQRVKRLRIHGLRLIALGFGLPLFQAAGIAVALLVVSQGSWILGNVLIALVILSALLQFIVLAKFYRASGASGLAALAFPFGAGIIGWILTRGASDLKHERPFKWGGHDYVCEAR
ncbi:glycosyltransferase family 2 protein [Phycisphaeraceae bacterium D3-23]